jgi:NAD dependent epimerase/dehydratase family enzyme
VRNREFSKALGRALHRPAVLPAPVFGLRLMIGEAAEILTASQRCVPRRTLESGFAFRYAWLDGALADLFAR